MEVEVSNRIARETAQIFFRACRVERLGDIAQIVTLETMIAMIMATLTVDAKPKDPVKFATGMSEELATEVHKRVVGYLKEKGLI